MSDWILIILTLINIPIVVGAWWLLFRTWSEFWYCFKYILKPNMFSWISGEYMEDTASTLKIFLWILLIPGLYFGELFLLPNSWTGGLRENVQTEFHEKQLRELKDRQVQERTFEVYRNGETYGPYPYKQLKWMLIEGEVLQRDQVRWFGTHRWVTIDKLKKTARDLPAASTTPETGDSSP
jgi:hypothetical protein